MTFDPGRGGGDRAFVQGGERCCPGGGVVTFDPGRGGGVVTPPPPLVGQTDACENRTFARFATRVVIIEFQDFFQASCHFCNVFKVEWKSCSLSGTKTSSQISRCVLKYSLHTPIK